MLQMINKSNQLVKFKVNALLVNFVQRDLVSMIKEVI